MQSINTFSELKILKQNDRQKISLVKDNNGKLYLKREIDGDKREIYKALQKINHPNIPKIHSVELTDRTTVIEEYINGKSLNELMEQNIRFDKKQITYITKQILSALEKLHAEKIIHRDIKPDNILIDGTSHVWLIDYDIARIYRDEIRKDTESMGTFGYAPIEQYGMLPTDYKTDIYAFGATLKTLLDHSTVKGYLNRIADKCKKLDPSQRYKNVASVKKAMRFKLTVSLLMTVIVAIAILSGAIYWFLNHYAPPGYVKVEQEMADAVRFHDFEESELVQKCYTYEGYDNLTIFGVDSASSHLLFLEDATRSGKIALGESNKTMIDAEISLYNGVLTVSLSDPYGHTFSGEFKYDPYYKYELVYNTDRRQNADIICWDIDHDGLEELLIGVDDGLFRIENNRILAYKNYCQGWCIKYNEGRGFTLCKGDMFSEGSKFWIYKEEIGVYLPYFSGTSEKYGISYYAINNGDEIAVY